MSQHQQSTRGLDLTACDKEPIHILGCIQSHGCLLALKEPELCIVQAANTEKIFNIETSHILQQSIEKIIGKENFELLNQKLSSTTSLADINPLLWTIDKQSFEITLHRSGGLLIAELEPTSPRDDNKSAAFYLKTYHMFQQLENATSSNSLYSGIVKHIKNIAKVDRVMMYTFHEDGHGEVVAEAIENGMDSFLGLHYPASDIPKQARALYIKNTIRIIADVQSDTAPLVPQNNPLTDEPLNLSYAVLRSVSPIHIQYLKNMGIRASMSISIVINNELWGLIVCHGNKPLQLPYEVRTACQFIGQISSWKITSFISRYRALRFQELRKEVSILCDAIREQENVSQTLGEQSSHLMNLANADGVCISYGGHYSCFGQTPTLSQSIKLCDFIINRNSDGLYCTDNLYKQFPPAKEYMETACGVLAIAISPDEGDVVIWFRKEILQTVTWAGNPNKSASLDSHQQLTPRASFAQWESLTRGSSKPWNQSEIEMAKELRRFLLDFKLKYYYKSNQEQAQQQALYSQQMQQKQEDYVDKICHEIRNPINGILGSVELLRSELNRIEALAKSKDGLEMRDLLQELSEARKNLKNIEECASHQAVVTNDVLNLSKIEQGKIVLEKSPYDLVYTMKNVVSMFNSSLEAKHIKVVEIYPEDSILIKGDAFRLKQVVVNLLSNAIKFTAEDGTITLKVNNIPTSDEEQVLHQITISDTGIGMTLEEQRNLFNRFSQASSKIQSQYGGSGLGLLISKEVISLLGGTISVSSQKDVGTSFTFNIQSIKLTQEERNMLLKTHSTIKASFENNSVSPKLIKPASKKILIVEDNIINQKVLAGFLKKHGHSPDAASNGKEGVDKFLSNDYDAVFMDIEMPIMNGYEAASAIRLKEKELKLNQVPIICLSGNVRESYRKKAFDSGMNLFIEKPFKPDDIAAVLQSIFEETI